jgi:hypothetical protein
MPNGNGNGFWKNVIVLIVIGGSFLGAWFKIEATVNAKVSESETRIEKRLDKMENKLDAILLAGGLQPADFN